MSDPVDSARSCDRLGVQLRSEEGGDVIPRCSHGAIILGCPDETCPEQNAYLAEQNAILDAMYERQRLDARRALGLPVPETVSGPVRGPNPKYVIVEEIRWWQ